MTQPKSTGELSQITQLALSWLQGLLDPAFISHVAHESCVTRLSTPFPVNETAVSDENLRSRTMKNVAVALRLRNLPPLGWLKVTTLVVIRRPRSEGVLWDSKGI